MRFNLYKLCFLLALLCCRPVGAQESDAAASPVWTGPADPVVVRGEGLRPVQWKFAHPAPPASHLPPVWEQGFEWLKKHTGGGFNIKTFGSGTLYGVAGGFKAIRAGIADYGTCYSVVESSGLELLKTFQVPYVAPDNPYLTARIINELLATRIRAEFEAKGVYPAHVAPVRPLNLMSKTPIRTPQDLKGKKVVSFVNAPGADKALGFAQVNMPFTEIYTALQQGLVDAVIWSDMGFLPFKVYEQARYYTPLQIAPLTVETCFNRRSFDRLPAPYKQPLYDFQQRAGIAITDAVENFSRVAWKKLQEEGVTFIELDAAQRQQWKAAFQPVVDQWLQSCDKAGKDCRGLIDEIERLAKKYQHLSNEELVQLAIEKPVQGMIDF